MISGPVPAIQSPEKKKVLEEVASEKSMQVLEIASKNVDTAQGLVSMASYILAVLGIVLALATVIIQIIGVTTRNAAVKKAIARTLSGLATNQEFAEQVLQEIIQKEKLKEYILAQIDLAAQETADKLLTKEYFEAKAAEMGVKWEQFINPKKDGQA